MILTHIGLISAVKIRVIFRRHVTAAAPVFIAYAEEINLPGLLMAVLLSQIRHRGYAFKSNILHPFGHFLNRTAAHIAVYIGFAAQLLTQFKKLMGSEAVVFLSLIHI